MAKVTTQEGINIEAKGDTLFFGNIPESKEWVLFSMKYDGEDTLPQNKFPRGVWKKVVNGETTFCLRDRGEGRHLLLIAFEEERKGYPDYTMQYTYLVEITADNDVIFPV